MLIRLLITMIVIAVSIQNTCPQGWAAKTAFATCGSLAKQPSHCPMHDKHKPAKQKDDTSGKKELSNTNQIFVLDIAEPERSFCSITSEIMTSPVKPDLFLNVAIEPLFRPPIVILLS